MVWKYVIGSVQHSRAFRVKRLAEAAHPSSADRFEL